jgi:hypothetical protein
MSLAVEQKAPRELLSDGPPFYMITLATWVTDRDTAIDLATQISESLAHNDLVDEHATTVGIEDTPIDEHERIYVHIIDGAPQGRSKVASGRPESTPM